ncbi:MAG TPA: excinuclease ABC subunit C [Acidobacteriaceae bacterium]|nr:excinuclease ABC subunit C [Acidobacteriaceae bacterium]
MAAHFHFEHNLAFVPERAAEILRNVPALPGVFALHGPRETDEPYLTRAADLRRRITRILAPPVSPDGSPTQSKRLNLSSRVASIAYTVTGSEFESNLTLYHAAASIFGLEAARKRLKLRTPYFLRFTTENAHPRVYSTNRLSRRALDNLYGPFPSRAAADRYCDAVLDLFKLRRCHEDLIPTPAHPGCVYQEMNKCLAPCNQAHTPEGAAAYSTEAAAVKQFFDTRGESLLAQITAQREQASAAMEFEQAASLHTQWQKVKSAQSLADELIQPIPRLRAILVQKAAANSPLPHPEPVTLSEEATASHPDRIVIPTAATPPPHPDKIVTPSAATSYPGKIVTASTAASSSHPDKIVILSEEPTASVGSQSKDLRFAESQPTAALFLLHSGCIAGPEPLSTLGVRAVKEQTAVGSSLFAQPLMLQAIPLEEPSPTSDPSTPAQPSSSLNESSLSSRSEAEEPVSPLPTLSTLNPERRAEQVIATLEQKASTPSDMGTLSDHLSLLRRWYYRPEKQRTGEIFFPRADGSIPKAEGASPEPEDPTSPSPDTCHPERSAAKSKDLRSSMPPQKAPQETNTAASRPPQWPIRRILRGAARMALGEPKPMADTQRDQAQRNPADEAQKPTRTKILHEGRADVQREVPVIDKKFRSRKSQAPPTSQS